MNKIKASDTTTPSVTAKRSQAKGGASMSSPSKSGEAKAPPRGAKRKPKAASAIKETPERQSVKEKPEKAYKRNAAPRMGVGAVSGFKGKLFNPEDVSRFAASSGVVVAAAAAADLGAIAWRLQQVFDLSMSAFNVEGLRSPPSEWKGWLDNVHRKAEALLAALDLPPGAETFRKRDLVYGRAGVMEGQGIQALLGQRQSVRLPDLFAMLPQQVRDAFPLHRAEGGEVRQLFPHVALNAAPWLIAYISELGRLGGEKYAQMPNAVRSKEPFSKLLFAHLAAVYEEMTGGPVSGLKDYAGGRLESPPPILWAQEVLTHAYRELPCVMDPARDDFREAILGVSKLSNDRKIDLFSTKIFEKTPPFRKKFQTHYEPEKGA